MREVFIVYAKVKNIINGDSYEALVKGFKSYPTQSELEEAVSRYTKENGWIFYYARVEKHYVRA